MTPSSECCSSKPADPDRRWIEGKIEIASESIPVVKTELDFFDRVGSWKARWGINRMNFTVKPGLYAVGSPDEDSPVAVTANYKMSFDRLRSQLGGKNVWILVLDTKGINVWCAAGKGTFGTAELLNRINKTGLKNKLDHRTLILPQLGATGVAAHEIKEESGFEVIYGPVQAEDLPEFLDADLKAEPEMREVKFPFLERLVLVPMEVMSYAKYYIPVLIVIFALSGIHSGGYSISRMFGRGFLNTGILTGAYLSGTVLVPLFLPFLPGKAFSTKGAWSGIVFSVILFSLTGNRFEYSPIALPGWILLVTAVSSFFGMFFTGASTLTSLSGVRREMKIAIPLQIAGAVIGLLLIIGGRFLHV